MNDDKFINNVIFAAAIIVVAPIVIGGAAAIVGAAGTLVGNGINKVKFHNQMKKGMKEGTIVKVDGSYYTVEINEEAI